MTTDLDLVGPAEVAERAGVTRAAVDRWRERHPAFPAPIVRLRQGPVWHWADVERWLRETGRRTE